eukprot:5227188-Lingulodinium_polyedra.AAC.1
MVLISEKEASHRQLRLAFDEMQYSSNVARSWCAYHLSQMGGSRQAERAQIANQLARATEVVAGRGGEIQELRSQLAIA